MTHRRRRLHRYSGWGRDRGRARRLAVASVQQLAAASGRLCVEFRNEIRWKQKNEAWPAGGSGTMVTWSFVDEKPIWTINLNFLLTRIPKSR
ncbi:hypothetical protein WCLP8_2870008 [uncultured Gammaproteobacteria bacterium]